MAHSRSARKRIRQNARRRLRNRSAKSTLRTAIKRFRSAVSAGDKAAAEEAYRHVQKTSDKTVRKGIVKKGTASRIKSRLSKHLHEMEAAAEK